MKQYDVIIIGAGAAGLFAGITLATRNRNTLILDKGDSVARKVAISGGGNCHFTNLSATNQPYHGKNPALVCSALAQFSPTDMLNFVKSKNIEYIEPEPNRFFCKNGANNIVDALLPSNKYIHIKQNTNVISIQKENDKFIVITDTDIFKSESVIVATGGISYQHLCVSDIGYKIAKQLGLSNEDFIDYNTKKDGLEKRNMNINKIQLKKYK
ncbi:MAG: NAD(P)/FAD-dependent oxidoreductase, partial [Alphaproteobacteria bacterium]|nr:NAD(P)/FAD-dependent oxidoreductase [Alphaproteobacteria bacterium]